jgi:DNA-binding PadR family transcriptional regulator
MYKNNMLVYDMMKPKDVLKLYILWSLEDSPKCGYEIKKEVEEFSPHTILSNAALYFSLRDLEKKKYIKGRSGARNKITYEITPAGRTAFLESKRKASKYALRFKDLYFELLDLAEGEACEST